MKPTCSKCSGDLEKLTTVVVLATVGFAVKKADHAVLLCRTCNRLHIQNETENRVDTWFDIT